MSPRSLLTAGCLGALACSASTSRPDGAPAYGASVEWVERSGDTGSQQQATGVALDPSGDVVLSGSFGGVFTLGPHPLSAQPSGSLFVAKLDPRGGPLWSKEWSGSSSSEGHAIAADRDGNVLLIGRQGAGSPSQTAPASGFFVAKLDPGGSTLWSTPLQSAYERFNLTVSGGGFAMMSARTPSGLYVEMVDPKGVECWNLTFPIACASGMSGIATNASASLAITGFYDCPVDLGGGKLPADGRHSAFVATFDSNGNPVWSRGFGVSGGDVSGSSAAMDDGGDVFVSGDYTGSPDLGPGALPASSGGLFVVKLDAGGHPVWSRGYDGAAAVAGGQGIALGPSGQVFVMGTGVAPGSTSSGSPGAFVLALSGTGDVAGASRFVPQDAGSSFVGAGIAVSPDAHVAFAGALSGTVAFGAKTLTSAGSLDVVTGVLAP